MSIVCQKLNKTMKIKNPEKTGENIMQEANEIKDNKTEETLLALVEITRT